MSQHIETQFVCTFDYEDESVDNLLQSILKDYRTEVIEWLSSMFDITDWNAYEGGIDTWWGLGSVFLYELGLEVSVKYSHQITITIS